MVEAIERFKSSSFELTDSTQLLGTAERRSGDKERTGLIPVNPIVPREILSPLICRDVDNEI